MRYANIYSSFPCPASGHFSAASRRVAPISVSVYCLRLVLAFSVSVYCLCLVLAFGVSVYCLRLEVAFSACVFAVRFRQLRIPPNYLVLMPILNTLPHNARLPQHVVSAVSHRLLWVASVTKNTSSAATHTINAHFVQSTPICL